jgi:hypothetical protein
MDDSGLAAPDGHEAVNHERRKEIEGFLKRGTWFSGLPPDIQDEILGRSVVRRHPKRAVLHTEGEHPSGLSTSSPSSDTKPSCASSPRPGDCLPRSA